jgi:hypothetical protein
MQPIAESVGGAVENLDNALFAPSDQAAEKRHLKNGAGDGNRTRDQQLGRLRKGRKL